MSLSPLLDPLPDAWNSLDLEGQWQEFLRCFDNPETNQRINWGRVQKMWADIIRGAR